MSTEQIFAAIMGIIVLVAIVGTFDNTRKTAKLLEKVGKVLDEIRKGSGK